jgi:hypothetical protein
MRPCTRELSELKSSLERQILHIVTPKILFFPLSPHWTELFFHFCCDNGRLDDSDVQAGLADRMAYQRYVDGFSVFPVCGLSSRRWVVLFLACIPYLVLVCASVVGTSSIDWVN